MSAASRQGSCAACGGALGPEADLEFLIDDTVRLIAVHPGHSTIPDRVRRVDGDAAPDDDLGAAA